MKQVFKNALNIVGANLVLATPLLVFLLLVNLYLIIAKDAVKAIPSAILFFITLFLMISAFIAGWFYMIKVSVENFKNNKTTFQNEPLKLIKEFPAGIADYISSYMGFTLLFIIAIDVVMVSVYQLGMHMIGSCGISLKSFITATEAPVAMQTFIESLSKAQILKINYWYLLVMFVGQLFSLFTMFWSIEIMYSTKNPLKAFFLSISRIFLRPQSILLFICISFFNYVMMLFNYLSMFNPITYFVMTVIYFYFIVYVFVLLFLYYEEKIQSNCNSCTDSNGKD